MNETPLFNSRKNYFREASHVTLVARAGKWLRNNGCSVVFLEPGYGGLPEKPDAIGFQSQTSSSIVIEVKTSRADFLRDTKKEHRVSGVQLGRSRYYMAPKDMISVDELPVGWGLIEVLGSCGEVSPSRIKHGAVDHGSCENRQHAERRILIAAFANVQWQQNGWFPPRTHHAAANLGQAASDIAIRDEMCRELVAAYRNDYTHTNWKDALKTVRAMRKNKGFLEEKVRRLQEET